MVLQRIPLNQSMDTTAQANGLTKSEHPQTLHKILVDAGTYIVANEFCLRGFIRLGSQSLLQALRLLLERQHNTSQASPGSPHRALQLQISRSGENSHVDSSLETGLVWCCSHCKVHFLTVISFYHLSHRQTVGSKLPTRTSPKCDAKRPPSSLSPNSTLLEKSTYA